MTNTDDDLPIELPPAKPPAEAPVVARRATREVPPRAPSVRQTLLELASATSRDDATEIAMRFVARRWESSLLFVIKEGVAHGHRGHGANLSAAVVEAVAVPLAAPTIVAAAYDSRSLASEVPPDAGAIQARLTNLLGLPDTQLAAPIILGPHVASVLAVGDPQSEPIETSPAELDKLCDALGEAYARLILDAERSS